MDKHRKHPAHFFTERLTSEQSRAITVPLPESPVKLLGRPSNDYAEIPAGTPMSLLYPTSQDSNRDLKSFILGAHLPHRKTSGYAPVVVELSPGLFYQIFDPQPDVYRLNIGFSGNVIPNNISIVNRLALLVSGQHLSGHVRDRLAGYVHNQHHLAPGDYKHAAATDQPWTSTLTFVGARHFASMGSTLDFRDSYLTEERFAGVCSQLLKVDPHRKKPPVAIEEDGEWRIQIHRPGQTITSFTQREGK